MSEPIATRGRSYLLNSGKQVDVWHVTADTLREAIDVIPGDFKVYWHNQDRRLFTIEVIRTF